MYSQDWQIFGGDSISRAELNFLKVALWIAGVESSKLFNSAGVRFFFADVSLVMAFLSRYLPCSRRVAESFLKPGGDGLRSMS